MSENLAQHSKLHVLIVDCAQSDQHEDVPAATQNLEFYLAPTSSDVQEMMLFRAFDCVLVRINPGCRENLEQMATVRDLVVGHGVPLVSMSTFNASWIENLMAQLRVQKHFRQFPTHDELSNVLTKFADFTNGQIQGMAH